MKKKIIIISSVILLVTITLLAIFIKPKGKLKLSDTKISSITIASSFNKDESVELTKEEYVDFIKELNGLQYISRQSNYKTTGEYTVTIIYEDENSYIIDRYRTNKNGKVSRRLYQEDFDLLLKYYLK